MQVEGAVGWKKREGVSLLNNLEDPCAQSDVSPPLEKMLDPASYKWVCVSKKTH